MLELIKKKISPPAPATPSMQFDPMDMVITTRDRNYTYLAAARRQSLASFISEKQQVKPTEKKFKPYCTYGLMALNLLVFFIMMSVFKWEFESPSLNPTLGPSIMNLISAGAKETSLIVDQKQGWRLLTSMFLHSGFVHLALNGLTFYALALDVEEYCGRRIFIAVYLASGFSGQVSSAVFNPQLVGVGASGSIYGLLGLLCGDFLQNHKTIQVEKWKYFSRMMLTLVVGFIIGLLPIVDNW
jgi:membrane associated rhomboid family serine protease